MPVYKINVKWQKERFKDVECNTEESPEQLKAVLFSLTGVPPERQKVMMPGKILGDKNYDGIKLRNGITVMLMGTAEELPKMEVSEANIEEVKPRTESRVELPHGIVNLGNTCYANAAVQLLYSVPEVRAALEIANIEPNMNSLDGLSAHLRLLFTAMSKATKPVIPAVFITCLRTVCPQFAAQISPESEKEAAIGGLLPMLSGRFAQQDANECWTQLMLAIQRVSINLNSIPKIPDVLSHGVGAGGSWNPVDRFFTGRLICTLACAEAEEPVTETEESFTQLSCFINQDVKFLHTGIRNGFEGTVTKRSATLERDAVYKKTSVLTRLPAYLSVHFVRFFYKEDKQLNAKILKDVKFPLELDLFTFCSDSLQKQLLPMREKFRLDEDLAVHGLTKKEVTGKTSDEPDPWKKPDLYEPYSLDSDPGSNNSGYYELQGVLSHQGRTSSSGHYVAWVKVNGTWTKFDDDVVTAVTPEDILKLSGGGDWHCAYNLLYGPKRVRKHTDVTPQTSTMEIDSVVPKATTLDGDQLSK
ncbi:Ubiquitin carboxyl-terminal hydrolase [Fasciola gigantica]|uniref:Ubiquitin carboxyl-terminal hydrolase n=1 Tax=Fasciola gigantica TaxID=46835 RepID=A0A504Z097_FASGI|nr:Ubiquitin carboxyl-terminal hydrolase [Fasciola gigantica]